MPPWTHSLASPSPPPFNWWTPTHQQASGFINYLSQPLVPFHSWLKMKGTYNLHSWLPLPSQFGCLTKYCFLYSSACSQSDRKVKKTLTPSPSLSLFFFFLCSFAFISRDTCVSSRDTCVGVSAVVFHLARGHWRAECSSIAEHFWAYDSCSVSTTFHPIPEKGREAKEICDSFHKTSLGQRNSN